MSNYLRLLTAVASAFLIITFSGCATVVPGKFTAGGTLPNPGSDNGKATFTGHADSCNSPASPIKLSVNYDGHDGVTLMSTSVIDAGKCAAAGVGAPSTACADCASLGLAGAGTLYGADFTYESKSPDVPGMGTAFICVVDHEPSPPDFGLIDVLTGPFAGYIKSGPLSGNVESHPCS